VRLWILLILTLVSINTFAQADYRSGHIVLLNDEKVYGTINHRGDLRMSKLCRFKSDDGTVKDYRPSDIKGYKFLGGKYYVSKKYEGKDYFLEYLLDGVVSIYYLKDDVWEAYFVENEEYGLRALPNEEDLKYRDSTGDHVQKTRHLGILNLYMKDDPDIVKTLQSFKKPTHSNLVIIGKTYHENVCSEYDCVVYAKDIRATSEPAFFKGEIDVLGGISIFNPEQTLSDATGTGPTVGFKTNISIPRVSENFYFMMTLLICYVPNTGNSTRTNGIGFQYWTHIGYKAPKTLKLRPSVSVGLISPSYSAGLSYNLNERSRSHWQKLILKWQTSLGGDSDLDKILVFIPILIPFIFH